MSSAQANRTSTGHYRNTPLKMRLPRTTPRGEVERVFGAQNATANFPELPRRSAFKCAAGA